MKTPLLCSFLCLLLCFSSNASVIEDFNCIANNSLIEFPNNYISTKKDENLIKVDNPENLIYGNGVNPIASTLNVNATVDDFGNLIFDDPFNANDNLTITVDGINYRISDSTRVLVAGVGTIQEGNDVLVAIASVTGSININTGNGNDNLNVNLDGGAIVDAINFDGGNDVDGITLFGTGVYDEVSHAFTNATNNSHGTIAITVNGSISYSGLEGVIADNLKANERIFVFTGNTGGESLELNNAPSVLEYQLGTSTQGWIDFDFPNEALTIDAGSENFVDVNYFGTGVDANLTFKGNSLSWLDTLSINAEMDLGSGNLEMDSRKLNIYQSITTTGSITANIRGKIIIENAIVQSTVGDITMSAGTSLPQNIGIHLKGAAHVKTTSGHIQLDGRGNNDINLNIGLRLDTTYSGISSETGNIIINGRAGSSLGKSYGVYMTDASTIYSNGGAITITGLSTTTYNSNSGGHIGLYMTGATSVQNTDDGSIDITGIGGRSGTLGGNNGVVMNGDTFLMAEDGNVNIIATGTHGIPGNDGFRFLGKITTLGAGNVTIEGSRNPSPFHPDSAAINLTSASEIVSGGDITMTAQSGAILTPSGVPLESQCIASNTIINGELKPGASPGQMIVDGNFEMSTGDVLKLGLNGFTNPGIDFDQLKINGIVDITDTTLELTDTSGNFPSGGIDVTIIDNDGADPVIGTFNGLSQGASVAPNGKIWYIYYNQGDGNDVVLSSREPNVYIDSGNLTYDDIDGLGDNLTIIVDGANYRISDSGGALIAGAGSIQEGNDVLVEIASVTGAININTGNGNDSLNVNMDGGTFVDVINFDGGNDVDGITLLGTGFYDEVSHTFTNATNNSQGTIAITGNGAISYSGLEAVIADNLKADERTFVFTGNTGGESLELNNAPSALEYQLGTSTLGWIDFDFPNEALTIDAGNENFVDVNYFGIGVDANLTFKGNSLSWLDTLSINADIDLGSGNLEMDSRKLNIYQSITTTGSITANIRGKIVIENAIVQSTVGDITMSGGASLPQDRGIHLKGTAELRTTFGHIKLDGRGSNDSNLTTGLSLDGTSGIYSETGNITIDGNVSTTLGRSYGVHLINTATIHSNGGAITITGVSSTSTQNNNTGYHIGLYMGDAATIENTNNGSIDISGRGGWSGFLANNYGILMFFDTSIIAEHGNIDITAIGINSVPTNEGLRLFGTITTSGTGNIAIEGSKTFSSSISDESPDIHLTSTSQIVSGGDITLTSLSDGILTLSGVPLEPQCIANNTIVNGELKPGQSPGQMIVDGNFEMSTGDVLKLNVNNFTNPGIDFDQLKINGVVDIDDATLELMDTSGSFPSGDFYLVIIDNDGTDPVNGTFNNTTISGNGKTWYVYTNGGDGNDVVLSSRKDVYVSEGDLIYEDVDGFDDKLTIIVDGSNYRISDSGRQLVAGIGATQDGNDALVPITSVIGTINIKTGDGNDNLNVDLNGGDFSDEINYNGGNDTDEMSLSGTATYNNNVHTVNGAGGGIIAVAGNSDISYVGLEQTIVDNLDVDNRVFTINSSNYTHFEPTGSLGNQVFVDGLITIEYNNPNTTLAVNGAGATQGFCVISGFASGFDADLNITKVSDIVSFGASSGANTPTDVGTGAVLVVSKVVLVRSDVTTQGPIQLVSFDQAYVVEGDIISSAGQNIAIYGGTQPTGPSFTGLEIFESTIQTTGAGTITLFGTASLDNIVDTYNGMTLYDANIITETGNVDITGVGPTMGISHNRGINMANSVVIQSSGGNIDIVGTAGNSIGDENKGIIIYDGTNIQTTASGTITINGTGGMGTDANYGVEMQVNAVVSTENGNISITGISMDTSGADQVGILIDGTINITGTGNAFVAGTSGTVNDPAINMVSPNAQIQSGGNITMTANLGAINTPDGVTSQAQFNASNTIINGVLAPGQSPGQLILDGNLTMASDDTLEIEVNGFANVGSDYDQIVVNGTVDLNEVTLNLIDASGSFSSPENLILIDNDGSDPVIGTFDGLPNGSPIEGNGKTWYVYYNLAGSNDVLLSTSAPNVRIDESGNLVFQDPYSVDDNLTIIVEGINYHISDSGKPVIAGPGAIQDGNDVLVPMASVTGVVFIHTQDGNDHLNIDLEGGDFTNEIYFGGGAQNNSMSLSGTGTYASVAHTFTDSYLGVVDVSGNSRISYDELNQPIIDNLNVDDRFFTLDLDDNIVLDSLGSLGNQINISNGTVLDYENPLNSLTINSVGVGGNILMVRGVMAGFDADFTINATKDDDIRFDSNEAINIGSGDLNLNSGTLLFGSYSDISTTGAITVNTKSTTSILGIVRSDGGNISIMAGTEVTSKNNYNGIFMYEGHIETTGTGSIELNGTAYFNTPTDLTIDGLLIRRNSRIVTDMGNIVIQGQGIDNGLVDFRGLHMEESSSIQSNGGNITINGTGRDSSNNSNTGVLMLAGTTIETAGGGTINITGTGRTGLQLDGMVSATGTGNVWLQGTSGTEDASAINLPSSNARLEAGGFLYLTSNIGSINTPNDITLQTQFDAHTSINGVLAPGQSVGQLIMTGNLSMDGGDTLKMEVNDFTTAGSDYDQVVVNGIVNINGATLTLMDNSTVSNNVEVLVLIDNDGADSVIGTFDGLPNGASIVGNGKIWNIYYNDGDGNDVVLRSNLIHNVIVDNSGNLVFSNLYLMNDDLTIVVDGQNYRIGDSAKPVIAGSGAIQDGSDVLVPITSVTGTININTGDGDDSLNVNIDGGNFVDAIYFDGGDQADGMSLSGTSTHDNVTHVFMNTGEGVIDIMGNSIVIYTGLEQTIVDNLKVKDRIFTMNNEGSIDFNTFGTLENHIFAPGAVTLDFDNPFNSLTINGNGASENFITINKFGAGFDANLTVDRVNDIVQLGSGSSSNMMDLGSGVLNVTSKILLISGSINTQGAILTTSLERTFIAEGNILSSAGEDIIMSAGTDTQPEATYGMAMFDTTIKTTGSGRISLDGIAPQNTTSIIGIRSGMSLIDSNVITEIGDIDITGISLAGLSTDHGVALNPSTKIQSNGGDISIIGRGGEGSTGNSNFGILMGATIQTDNDGDISIMGISGTGTDLNYGVEVQNGSGILAKDGDISIVGISSDTTGTDQFGINFDGSATTLTGTGDIFLEGTSGTVGASAINMSYGGATLQSGGDLNMTANSGSINTTSGVTGVQFNFVSDNDNKVVVNGILSPGQSPGQMIIHGNFEMNSGDTLEMEINDFNTPGIDYDQVVINNGLVDITGTTLALNDNSGVLSEDPETLVLIDKDGTDLVVGTFDGLPNGASMAGNGKTWYIYYHQGDGNDVILSSDVIYETLSVSPKVYLQGAALNPNAGEETLMRDDLRLANYLPTTTPYSDGAMTNSSVFSTLGVNAIVDWVWVELRSDVDNTLVVSGQSALLQRDADVVGLDGVSPLTFTGTVGNYFIVVKHRNHLGVMSSSTYLMTSTNTMVDFTDANNQRTYGIDAQTTLGMPSDVVAMWAGDANGDGRLNYSGTLSDVPAIRSQVFNDSDNSVFGGPPVASYQSMGYYETDVNMDGVSVYSGVASDVLQIRNNIFNNPSNSVFGGPPTSTYLFIQQLPEGGN